MYSSEKAGYYTNATFDRAPAPGAPPPYIVPDPARPQPASTAYYSPASSNAIVVNMPPVSDPPRDYLIWSIINTVFFCFWIGIAAIIKSVRAREAISRGDRAGAESASKTAMILNILGTVFGILTIIGLIVYFVVFYHSFSSSFSGYFYK